MTSALSDQILDVGPKGDSELLKNADSRVAATALQTTQIGLMDVGLVGELLLREPALASKPLKIETDSGPHIHAGITRRPRVPIP